MKILNFNDFVKESVLNVTRSITETIELENISTRTWWDCEPWYDFDHERKGTYEDFKKLERNKRASFDIHMDFFFEILDEEGEYVDDICKVHTETKLYFTDMEIDDYDIDCKVCNDVDELVEFAKDYNDVTEENILELIKDAWDEYDIDDDLEMDLEDKCGKRDWDRIIDEIKEKIIGRIISDYNRFNQ